MKSPRILPFLLSLLFLFGCDLIDKIRNLEIEIDTEVWKTIPVDITEEDDANINEPFTIDATSDPDIQEYQSKIKSFDVKEIYIRFLNYFDEVNGDITFNGTITIGNVYINVNEKPSEYLGRVMVVTPDQMALDMLNADLNQDNKLEGSIVGTVSGKPVSFTMEIYIEFVAIAEE